MNFDISLDLYKIFCAVVRSGSMSVAARELYISQPAISMAIRKLEEKLGKPLLIRQSKGIKTTAEGTLMYGYLSQAIDLITIAERKYSEMVSLEIGEIKISAGNTFITRFLMPYIKEFLENNASINIKLIERAASETIRLLKDGQADIGFIHLPAEDDPSLEVAPLIHIHDCVVGGTKYAGLSKTGIKLEDLQKYPLLLPEAETDSRRFLDDYAAQKSVSLNPSVELDGDEFLLKFAKLNFGLAAVTREFSVNEINGQDLFEIPLTPPFPARAIGLVKLKHMTLSHAADEFLKNIIKVKNLSL